jgi:hypothetical protein
MWHQSRTLLICRREPRKRHWNLAISRPCPPGTIQHESPRPRGIYFWHEEAEKNKIKETRHGSVKKARRKLRLKHVGIMNYAWGRGSLAHHVFLEMTTTISTGGVEGVGRPSCDERGHLVEKFCGWGKPQAVRPCFNPVHWNGSFVH